jgi:hypothetical protein
MKYASLRYSLGLRMRGLTVAQFPKGETDQISTLHVYCNEQSTRNAIQLINQFNNTHDDQLAIEGLMSAHCQGHRRQDQE